MTKIFRMKFPYELTSDFSDEQLFTTFKSLNVEQHIIDRKNYYGQ